MMPETFYPWNINKENPRIATSNHDPNWEFRASYEPRSFTLVNNLTGETHNIGTGYSGVAAMDIAEGIICDGLENASEANKLGELARVDEKREEKEGI